MTIEHVEPVVAALILIGAFFTLVGSLGLVRFQSFHGRLHGPTKATTLGVGGIMAASILYFAFATEGVPLDKILIAVFLFLTAPVSGYLMAKTGVRLGLSQNPAPPPEWSRHRHDVESDTPEDHQP